MDASSLEEMQFRWRSTTPQWPIMSAMLHGVSRDQMMARHKALAAKASMFAEMGINVHLSGEVKAG